MRDLEDDDLLELPADILERLRAEGAYFISARFHSVLLEEAQEAAARAADALQSGKRRRESGAAAAAVLCASAACETWVSEYLAHWEAVGGPLPTDLAAIRSNPDALEQWRILLRASAPHFVVGNSREYQHLG